MDTTEFTREKEVCKKPNTYDPSSADELAGLLRREFLEKPLDAVRKEGWKVEKSDDEVVNVRAWYGKDGNLDKQWGFGAWIKCNEKESVYYEYNRDISLQRVMVIPTPKDVEK